jgi:hypothetical protein
MEEIIEILSKYKPDALLHTIPFEDFDQGGDINKAIQLVYPDVIGFEFVSSLYKYWRHTVAELQEILLQSINE